MMTETGNKAMRTYVAFYKQKKIVVQAPSSYEAQTIAAAQFKARKAYEVAVVLADVPVDPAVV
jgi:hypothetical protein